MTKNGNKKVRKYEELNCLKGLIREKKYSYKSLSQEMALSVDAINNKLNGYTMLTVYDIVSFMKVLDIDNSQIMKYFLPQCCKTQ